VYALRSDGQISTEQTLNKIIFRVSTVTTCVTRYYRFTIAVSIVLLIRKIIPKSKDGVEMVYTALLQKEMTDANEQPLTYPALSKPAREEKILYMKLVGLDRFKIVKIGNTVVINLNYQGDC
jgi:hypothetical protein